MSKQVRISDDIAEWLEQQGGSLSAAAERTLCWARDAIEGVEEDGIVVDEPVDRYVPPPAGDRPTARTSTSSARRRPSFSPIIRRP